MIIQPLDKTPISAEIMQFACDITQKKADDITNKKMSSNLAHYLLKAEHDSIFEHSSITFLARGVSRSLLAQITRQRTFKFTSASQHYQNYKDYPMSIRPGWDENEKIKAIYKQSLESSLNYYLALIRYGEPPEEARQVLPNACTVNIMITADPRNLVKFLRARLCKRNTMEMFLFANTLLGICRNWIPQIFRLVGPPCIMDGKCNQGKMKAIECISKN